MRSGSLAVSASAISASRSMSAESTKSIEAFRAGRRFLLDAADARALGDDDRAALGRELAADQAEERGLAGAVAPDEPDMRARGQRRGGVVDQQALAKPIGEGADMQHGRAFRAARVALARSGGLRHIGWTGRTLEMRIARSPFRRPC